VRSERLTNLTVLRPQGVACEQVTDQLPGILDGADEAEPSVISHVEQCSRCQAELAQYRLLLRALHQLRVVGVDPPDGLLSEVLAQLGEAAERGAIRSALTGRRVSYLAALAAAAGAAGVAGVAVVLANRGVNGGANRGAGRVRSGEQAGRPARLGAKMPLAS
jgi:hypothetical protein